jgi:two-component SAPR family response regulator
MLRAMIVDDEELSVKWLKKILSESGEVTAYDNYAVQAFELSALDYLMKPVTAQRMSEIVGQD